MYYKVGQKVRWNDPAVQDYVDAGYDIDEVLARVFIIHEIDNREGTAYIVEEGGGSEAEVYIDELELV